eukprot:541441-Alexandrium_andersonii.AAC.1
MAGAAIIDTKTLGKPPELIGERSQEYADWSFITRAYLRQVDAAFGDIFNIIDSVPDDEEDGLRLGRLGEIHRRRADTMMAVLTMLCQK